MALDAACTKRFRTGDLLTAGPTVLIIGTVGRVDSEPGRWPEREAIADDVSKIVGCLRFKIGTDSGTFLLPRDKRTTGDR